MTEKTERKNLPVFQVAWFLLAICFCLWAMGNHLSDGNLPGGMIFGGIAIFLGITYAAAATRR